MEHQAMATTEKSALLTSQPTAADDDAPPPYSWKPSVSYSRAEQNAGDRLTHAGTIEKRLHNLHCMHACITHFSTSVALHAQARSGMCMLAIAILFTDARATTATLAVTFTICVLMM